jgi:aspartate/methionine/tyrosine aminotransferase
MHSKNNTDVHEPWSKKHKRVTKSSQGGLKYSLSNSYTQPLTNVELLHLTRSRGDLRLVEQYENHTLGYTPNGGSLDLREEISHLYGETITAENVLVFAGAQVALQTAALALSKDCHSIVFLPGYQSTAMGPAMAGGDVTKIMLSPSNGWAIPLDKVAQAIQPGKTKYLVINEPYNPAGTLMSQQTQQELIALAKKHSIIIMSDEVYRLLEHDSNDRLPAMADVYCQGISCVTMSKPWGGCGITIGWLAFPDVSLKQKLIDVQYFGTACPSRASELQAMMVLRASDHILHKNLTIVRHNKTLLKQFMHTYADLFSWTEPTAGAVAFIKFKGPMTSEQLGEQLAMQNISIKPAYCFSDEITDETDCFRVGFGEEKMPKALAALGAFVEHHKENWRLAMRERRRRKSKL